MFRQITIFCIATLMVLSAVFYSQAQDAPVQATPGGPVATLEASSAAPEDRGGARGGSRGGRGAGVRGARISPEQKARNQLGMAQQRLAKAEDEKAKQEAIAVIREALGAYFDVDVARRQSELAAIKKRVAEMEGLLKKRVDAKRDIIALRLQVLMNDADGLGWSNNGFKENAARSRISFGRGSNSDPFELSPTYAVPAPSSSVTLAEPQN